MKLRRVTLKNLGPYQGEHDLPLAVDAQAEPASLVVVRGHNGAGKSTLFQSIGICLYGHGFLGPSVSRVAYLRHVGGLMSRLASDQATQASVSLELLTVVEGSEVSATVTRSWSGTGKPTEALSVLSGDELLEGAQAASWLQAVLPWNTMRLTFFDAENVVGLKSSELSSMLGDVVEESLGLDLVAQAIKDLEHFLLSQDPDGRDKEISALGSLERRVSEAGRELLEAEDELARLQEDQARTNRELFETQRIANLAGSCVGADDPLVAEELRALDADLSEVRGALLQELGGVAPYAVARQTMDRLGARLKAEEDALAIETALVEWGKAKELVQGALRDECLWEGLDSSGKTRDMLLERVVGRLKAGAPKATSVEIRHDLGRSEREAIRGWVRDAQNGLPERLGGLAARLLELDRRRSGLFGGVQGDAAQVEELQSALARAEEEARRSESSVQAATERIGAARAYLEKLEAEHVVLFKRIASRGDRGQQAHTLAAKTAGALSDYRDRMLKLRLGQLSSSFLEVFNGACRKKDLIRTVHVDSRSLDIKLITDSGDRVEIGRLSTGERQLATLSFLHAVRRMRGRSLPFFVDTPLARMDEEHSVSIERTLTATEEQVFLFLTDKEWETLEPLVRNQDPLAYSLSCSSRTSPTSVTRLE